jgi:hypothetical protein
LVLLVIMLGTGLYVLVRVGTKVLDGDSFALLSLVAIVGTMAVGLFVNARIGAVSEQQAFVMPRLALRNKNEVYVINGDNRLEIRTVDVVATSDERVVVASGVDHGEQVVTSTLPNAVDGMEVEPILRDGGTVAGAGGNLRNG